MAFLTRRMLASAIIRVFPSLEHSTDCVRKSADNFRTFVCVPNDAAEQNITARSRCLNWHLPYFSIAHANEFRFARFYIVCEAASLGTPGSPLIVCDLSDTLRKCPNVEETRNPMQTSNRKKCSHFSQTNVPSAFPAEICVVCFL